MPGSSILRLAHAICGRLALATIASFFAASAAAKAARGEALFLPVKTAILRRLAVLIPAPAATGTMCLSAACQSRSTPSGSLQSAV